MPKGLKGFQKGNKLGLTSFLGKKHTEKTKEKFRLNTIGKWANEKNPNWKGIDVGYAGIHHWLVRNFGKAIKCEKCGLSEAPVNKQKYFQWALLKGKKYERNRNNFWMLCIKCHRNYDWTDEWRNNIQFAKKINKILWN